MFLWSVCDVGRALQDETMQQQKEDMRKEIAAVGSLVVDFIFWLIC